MPRGLASAAPLANVRLVLVAPMYAGNVGACARVAANYEARDLKIVAPRSRWNTREAKLYAKGPAAEYLAATQEAASLDAALAGCAHAVGFTRRVGELRRPSLALSEIGAVAGRADGTSRVALVFGREDGGLTREELLRCTHVCALPVAATMPSLNLSHAVAVVLSRVFEDALGAAREKTRTPGALSPDVLPPDPLPIDELETLLAHWRQAMLDAGMKTAGNPDRMLAHIRRALQRASLSRRDAGIFRAYLSKTQVAMGARRRG